jgi:hypothetical protein
VDLSKGYGCSVPQIRYTEARGQSLFEEGEGNVPRVLRARLPKDAEEERKIRTIAGSRHASKAIASATPASSPVAGRGYATPRSPRSSALSPQECPGAYPPLPGTSSVHHDDLKAHPPSNECLHQEVRRLPGEYRALGQAGVSNLRLPRGRCGRSGWSSPHSASVNAAPYGARTVAVGEAGSAVAPPV